MYTNKPKIIFNKQQIFLNGVNETIASDCIIVFWGKNTLSQTQIIKFKIVSFLVNNFVTNYFGVRRLLFHNRA